MRISTKLRILSMKNGIRGNVAKIILNNVENGTDIEIARWIKDVVNNGCAYSNVKGLRYHLELEDFYKKNETDIELIVFLYETSPNTISEKVDEHHGKRSWFAFEQMLAELMIKLNIK